MPYKSKLVNIKAINGKVQLCDYCGEQIGNSQTKCSTCRTKAGRQEIYNNNLKAWTSQGMSEEEAKATLKQP